ncbi:MAG TPA: DUF2934 domain-containing protein [Burkholderiales bacterium]|jgi:hypothetical protein|nr:DUF2934 domain-containing protein [Burkholderiales bacterium]
MITSATSGATRSHGKATRGAATESSGEAANVRGKNATGTKPPIKIGSQEWQEMVAAAAYYRAEARGFYGGSPERDWLDAEAELLERLAPKSKRHAPKQPKPVTKRSGKSTR